MAQSETLRAGILAGTLPAALRIYDELKGLPRLRLYIILCRAHGEARVRFLFKHAARWLTGRGRMTTLRLLLSRRLLFFQKPLDDAESLRTLSRLHLDVGLHKVGVIYREATIGAFRLGILNPHIGLLPRYRGRAVMEWSLLEGEPTGITVFFIDRGIDTGERIVLREEVDISHCRSIEEAKSYLFNLDA
ncbi:MAG TPA: formyltransferase family protein, partial [Pyrinomonadaceae bacterium]|nr:formyltransferase family protein [Pyrinomonadaceae bacterium]